MADWPDRDKHNQESAANYYSYNWPYEPKELNIIKTIKNKITHLIFAISYINIMTISLIIAGFIIFAGFIQIKFNQNILARNLN